MCDPPLLHPLLQSLVDSSPDTYVLTGNSKYFPGFVKSSTSVSFFNYLLPSLLFIALVLTLFLSLSACITGIVCVSCRHCHACQKFRCGNTNANTPYSSCERNRPIFTRLFFSIFYLSGGAMVFVYGWTFSAHALPNVACEFNAMHLNVCEMYNHGINNQSLQNYINAAATTVTTDPQTINQYNYATRLTAIELTLTNLQNTINITAAPIFTPNNTKFYCYIANKPLDFMIQTSQNKIALLQTATKKIQPISHYLQQIENQQHSSRYPVSTATAQSAIKQQDAVLSFANGDWSRIGTQFSQTVNENTSNTWIFWVVGLAVLPFFVCLCGCCGFGMILCGEADDSESLEDWDKEVGMFKHSRRVLRLTGCVAKTGAKINGSAIYCSFFVSAIYFLTGGFALVLNSFGNDLCTSLPTLLADLPLYVPTASPADNNRLSNERIQNSLLPICLSASGKNINTTIISSVFNLSTIQYKTLVNVTADPTAWSDINDAIQDVRSNLAAIQHSNTNCFLESSASTYEKISTDAKSFVHYNSSSSTYGNAYRHQTTYIEGVLQEMTIHLNMSAMDTALQQLEDIVKSISRVERHLTQLQQGYNVTALLHYCRAVQESKHRFQHSACENTMPLLFLIGASLFFSGAVGVLVGFDTLCLQNRWGGHGPIPLSIAQPSLQHRQSTIEMKQNPMGGGGARSDNVVFDLHGEMKPTSWM